MNTIIVCQEKRTQAALIKMIMETTGIKPFGTRNTVAVDRALYEPTSTRAIVNWTRDKKMLETLGYPSSAVALTVDDVNVAGQKAKEVLSSYRMDFGIYRDLDPDMPKGLIVFLKIDALPGTVFLFWPKAPATGGPAPQHWNDDGDLAPPEAFP